MRIGIDPEVYAAWPSYRRIVVLVRDVDNAEADPALEALLREAEAAARLDPELENHKEYPRIASWRAVFEWMGLNPNKFPPSIANLVKRTRSGKDLPFVNRLVAIFNIVSLKYRIPCGGDDLEGVTGDVILMAAKGDETYEPLGNPEALERPNPGEIILVDTGRRTVFCRGWCWKNGDPSKITRESRTVAINLDAQPPVDLETLWKAAEELAALVKAHCGGTAELHLLEPASPTFEA